MLSAYQELRCRNTLFGSNAVRVNDHPTDVSNQLARDRANPLRPVPELSARCDVLSQNSRDHRIVYGLTQSLHRCARLDAEKRVAVVENRHWHLRLTSDISKVVLMAVRVTYPTIEGYNARCGAWVVLYELPGIDGRRCFSLRPEPKRNVCQLCVAGAKHGSWRDRQPN